MMSRFRESRIIDQAIAWHLRLEHADGDAWAEFSEWLEADPAHNDAYQAVADKDALLSPLLLKAKFPATQELTESIAGNDDTPDDLTPDLDATTGRGSAGRWRWGALAATIALVGVVAIQFVPSGNHAYVVETAPGQTRTIALTDGSEIMLNGGTRIALDRSDERTAELLSGEARFKVSHDDSDPFTVVAGDRRLVDIGTVFNVIQSGRQLRVAVAEGSVRFEGVSRKIDLKAGDALSAGANGSIQIARQPAAAIGSWADGVLIYDETPLSVVSEDLSRSLGVKMTMPPTLQSQAFSGVIQTEGGEQAVRERIEMLLGHTIMADGLNWTVQP